MKKFNLFLYSVLIIIICTTCRKYEKLMMVSTGTSSEISDNSAQVSGQIVDEGEGITQYGHYISTTSGNTSAGTMVQSTNKSSDGEYTTQLTGLTPDTKYYTKAYISDKEKTVYGKEISFTTLTLLKPELSGSVIENATPALLELTFNLALANIIPAPSAFTVMVNSSTRAVNTVAINGTKVQLTLSSPVNYGDVVTVDYTKPASNQLQTPQGGQAASITAQGVTNNVLAAIPAYVSSVIENATPSVLEMTYNLALSNIVPATSAFTVLVNSSARAVNTVAVNGTKVQLTLASPVSFSDVVTVAYTKPASNQLQTPQGGQAASITAQNVTNNVLSPIPEYLSSVIENATPSVLEMTYSLTLANIIPATSAYTVMVNSSARAVNTVIISGTKVQLTLASQVNYGDVVTVAYTKPGSNQLQTAQGGQAASIAARNVTNNVQGAVPAYVSSVIEDATPNLLEMTYSLALVNIVPATSAFTVLVNGSGNNISNVEISGTKVRLTLAIPVVYGDLITVSYTKPASNPLQTSSGGLAMSFSNQSVINNTKVIPVVITSAVTNITITTANSGGEVINDGGEQIIQKGVCWSTSPNPTISGNHTEDGVGTGAFSSYLSGLNANTTYYLRAYAANSKGTGYGNELTFKTFTGTVKDIQNNSYYTVTIGTQVWMAQNLRVSNLNDGTSIPLIINNSNWSELTTPAFCWYNDETDFKTTYGALYNWYSVNTGMLCPTGWHLPSDAEWTSLIDFLGGTITAGGMLKEAGFQHWISPNSGASNESGFTALPGGQRLNNGSLTHLYYYGNWWSSTQYGTESAWRRHLSYENKTVEKFNADMNYGFSVRCLHGEIPFARTLNPGDIMLTSATLSGNVYANGTLTTVSFEYGTTESYGMSSEALENPIFGTALVNVSAEVTGLTPNTLYHCRIKAVNSGGTTYGADITFITAPLTIADVDGNVYNCIEIGKQVWTKENLKTTKYNDGIQIPNITDGSTWANTWSPAFCWYANDPLTYKEPYGALYNWYVIGTSKICPLGWHIPTQEEWTKLITLLGGEEIAGGKMKEIGFLHWDSPNTGATNESNFTALPGGSRRDASFGGIKTAGFFHTADYGISRVLSNVSSTVGINPDPPTCGFSARCIRD